MATAQQVVDALKHDPALVHDVWSILSQTVLLTSWVPETGRDGGGDANGWFRHDRQGRCRGEIRRVRGVWVWRLFQPVRSNSSKGDEVVWDKQPLRSGVRPSALLAAQEVDYLLTQMGAVTSPQLDPEIWHEIKNEGGPRWHVMREIGWRVGEMPEDGSEPEVWWLRKTGPWEPLDDFRVRRGPTGEVAAVVWKVASGGWGFALTDEMATWEAGSKEIGPTLQKAQGDAGLETLAKKAADDLLREHGYMVPE